jgi:Tfp pilus assembly PilM family ATPase
MINKIAFKKFYNLINPQPEIAGLEISDAYLRYILLMGKKASFISIKLPPGVIENGKIKDKDKFLIIISDFYKKISPNNKKKYIIVNIPDANVYTEMFSLPKVAEKDLEEAINLNLRMISPIDFDNAYIDWQIIGQKLSNGMIQSEILGSFVPKQVIDDYESILSKAGFEVVAIEFPGIALTRSVVNLSEGFDKNKNYILMRVGSDGLSFNFIKNGNLYFLHFISWASAYGDQRQVSFDLIKNLVIVETQKVLSFYETHSEGNIDGMFLVSPTLTDEISKIISDNFHNLIVKIPVFSEFKNVEPVWFSAVGSAVRGLKPRSEDSDISLLSAGTEEKFVNYQISAFIGIWRNIILSVLGAIVIFFGGLDFIIMSNASALAARVNSISGIPGADKISDLQKQAIDFNRKADLIYSAYNSRILWSPFFRQISQLAADNDITVKRLLIQSLTAPVLLVGEADSEDKIIDFKTVLESQAQYSDINFQLSNISKGVGGNLNFSISFKFKNGE